MNAYKELQNVFTKMYRLDHFLALGDWDLNVNMPPKGEEARGEAMAVLAEMRFQLLTSADNKVLLEQAEAGHNELSLAQRANLREMRTEHKRAVALPSDFVARRMRLTTAAHNAWKDSRAKNDFGLFLPVLKQLIAVAREEGGYLAAGTSMSPYEALMNLYEPGLTTARLDEVFGNVKTWLPEMLQRIVAKQAREEVVPIRTPLPLDVQERMSKDFMGVMMMDPNASRLDISPHPFTGMTKEDCRLTNNYTEEDFIQGLYGVLHEGGHGKYEQNCGPRDMITQPICRARSMGVHESQSLFAEFQIGHSAEFTSYLKTALCSYYGDQPAFTEENLTKILQRVKPGYIRIDADEVCYPLHVILRYEIERGLMEGDFETEDVPRVWNDKMQQYLGLETLGKDNVGCLQDVHWAQGYFGYFPTYSLGAMYAAQIMATIRKELGDEKVDACLRGGSFSPLFAKLKEKIWDHGCLYDTDELMTRATGETLNPEYFKRHLEKRYLGA